MTLKITLPDGNALELPDGATGADAAAAIGPGLARAALAIEVSHPEAGEPPSCATWRARCPTARTSRSSPPQRASEALALIRHDAAHVLAAAVMELYPGVKISIGPAIEDGFYYDFEFPDGVSSPRPTSRRSRRACASTSRPPRPSCARTSRSRTRASASSTSARTTRSS